MAAFKLKIAPILLILLGLVVPAWKPAALAQQTAQQTVQTLDVASPVSGSVPPNGVERWTFPAQSGEVLSFVVKAAAPELDAALMLTDSSGREISRSDDTHYPDNLDPLLEAVTMPRTDTYTLTVSGVNGTSGDYALTMLPGYSLLDYTDDFSTSAWRPLTDTLTLAQTDEQLALSVAGNRTSGVAFDADAAAVSDFYAQADVVSVSNASGWVVGMALRRQADSYYLLSINEQGFWRFTLVSGDSEQVIRDWTPHPNVIPGQTTFSIGVLAHDVGFDFFYNSGYIGSASDSTLTGAGAIGLMIGTPASSVGETDATFDNLLVTTPTLIDGMGVIPQEVQSGDGRAMVQALKHYRLISAAGEMSLTLDSSSVQFAGPGINRMMLGRGTQYTDFAIGTTVDIAPTSAGPAGCGIVFRFTSESDYTLAYLDQQGAYGVSTRSGDTFSDGLSGMNAASGAGQHTLLVVANEETVYYYVDRQLVGSITDTPRSGEVGIAVVNFEPNSTTCQYSNFWLWKWR